MSEPEPGIRDDVAPPWVYLTDGIYVRRMVEAHGSSIFLYRLEAGRHFALHDHPFPELGVVLAGRGRLVMSAEEKSLQEGDSYYIPAGAPHGFAVDSENPVVLMNVTSPIPPDVSGPSYDEVLRIARQAARATREHPAAIEP